MGAKDYPFSFNNFEEAAFEFEPLRGLDSKISNRWTASDFTWTLGSRAGLRLPLYIGCNLYADSGAAA